MGKTVSLGYGAEYERYTKDKGVLELMTSMLVADVRLTLHTAGSPTLVLKLSVDKEDARDWKFKGLVLNHVDDAQPIDRFGKKSIYRKLYKQHKKLLKRRFKKVLPYVKDESVILVMHGLMKIHVDDINQLDLMASGYID